MFLTVGVRVFLAVLLSVAWEAVRLLNGARLSWMTVAGRAMLTIVVLNASLWVASSRRRWLASLFAAPLVFLVVCWLDLRQPDTRLAWVGVASLYVALLALESASAAATKERGGCATRIEWGVGVLVLAIVGAVIPVTLAQVESHFAEEEFFAAVQIAFLSLFNLLLLLAQAVARRFDVASLWKPVNIRPLWVGLGLLSVGGALALWSGRAYQASFFSASAPVYEGVSAEKPFVCASLARADGAPDGEQVFARILALVENNPRKGVPEFGMLALATDERRWAEAFRQAILAEAEAGFFTEPANSVKYGQRLAAQRVYYFILMRESFPDLLSDQDLERLGSWFAAINRRALTVEWVDLLYGLAFSYWPEGPYENQENGAGLLALLEKGGLGDEELAAANRDYLAGNVRGWAQRFRNTDDAYTYQAEWIDNALFQAMYEGAGADRFDRHRQLAFEWMLLQALPGGAPLTYNRPQILPVANTLYLGALLLDDPRYVWAADQALARLESNDGYLYAQPGLERAAEVTGAAPTQGTCLLFSQSGLPTQVGPLAPDKIVFRDGWSDDAIYLLLNLRFTGWHRYKGTNDITLLHQGEPVVLEESIGQPFAWLPSGRQHFRDKRIPRENLNGILIPRSGFSQVVYALDGLNGPWAQDPPHHASVVDFHTLGVLDASRTAIDDWRGWTHQRTIYFFHGGPVIVVDDARHADGDGRSALAWHLAGLGERSDAGLWLRRGDAPLRMALPAASWDVTTVEEHAALTPDHTWSVTYVSPEAGELQLVTSFLTGEWAVGDFEVSEVRRAGELVGQYVRLDKQDTVVFLLHNQSSTAITAHGLTTDGLALITMTDALERPHTVCALGGTQAALRLDREPRSLRSFGDGEHAQRGRDWEWDNGVLTMSPTSPVAGCVVLDY